MSRLKLDSPDIKTQKIGNGTFGAKTTNAEAFGKLLEKYDIPFAPHISLPREFFLAALKRAGYLNEDESYNPGTKKEIRFNRHETEILKEIFTQLQGRLIAIRSDEQSAKGIGLFESSLDLFYNFKDFLSSLGYTLKRQFSNDANLFKRLMKWPEGIGIQFSPLIGETFGMLEVLDYFAPLVSLSGLTVKDKNELIISIGFGLGGGVSQDALHFRISSENPFILEFPDNTKVFDLNGSNIINKVSLNFLSRYEFVPRKSVFEEQTYSLITKIMSLAKDSGSDVYFEIQSQRLGDGIWKSTQICKHTWPTVIKPEGKDVILVKGFKNIVGSGVMEFDRYIHSNILFNAVCPDRNSVIKLNNLIRDNPGALIFSNYVNALTIWSMLTLGAYIDLDPSHKYSLSSHTHGCVREAGKIFLVTKEAVMLINDLYKYNGKIAVWADEANEVGGVVLV